MSTLFMIGNGFDLNCGLKTRYIDVYNEYIKTESLTENISKFKKDISDNYSTWSDFEMGMSKYAQVFDSEQNFVECVDDFRTFLKLYLENEEKSFIDLISHSSVADDINNEIKKSLIYFYNGITKNIDLEMINRRAGEIRYMSFVSFNYTKIFDYMINIAYKSMVDTSVPKVTHVHGDLYDLTLGVDNEEQLTTAFDVTNLSRRCFIKPYFNQEYDYQRISETMEKINKTQTICVYGMSLGESDLTWRNKLIDWLSSSQGNHLFIYDYDLLDINTDIIHKRMDIEENAKLMLFNKWGISKIDSYFDRLHIVCGKNIFNVNQFI